MSGIRHALCLGLMLSVVGCPEPNPDVTPDLQETQTNIDPTQSAEPSPTTSPSGTQTAAPSPSATDLVPTPSEAPTPTVEATPTATVAAPSPSLPPPTATATAEPTPTATAEPTPTATAEPTPTATAEPTPTAITDADGDGYGAADDCDDSDAAFNPGATEDDCTDPNDYNCDGSVGYADADNDGAAACEDCDDNNPLALPGGTEVCDGADNDCDSTADEGVTLTAYRDVDDDGYGDDNNTTVACEIADGYAAQGGDCDDRQGTVNPGATELCDSVDNNCDGSNNEGLGQSWYLDADQDTYGGGAPITACAAPTSAYTTTDGDCDDLNAAINPDGVETCDSADQDCDNAIDEEAQGAPTFYLDSDGDGFGDSASPIDACELPGGYTDVAGDCDDAVATTYPAAPELCDGVDNDCDGDGDAGALGTDQACAARSCLEIMETLDDAQTGLAWLDPSGEGAPFRAMCDQDTADGGWTRIYYQSTEESTFFAEGEFEKNKEEPEAVLYAVLNDLESFRREGGFEFLMDWPESSFTDYQQWYQISNPVTDAPGDIPEGYEGIHIPYTSQGWASGLQRSLNTQYSLLDGTMSPLSNWYYAVGTTYTWNSLPNSQPGPTGGVPIVELWVR